MNEPINGYMVVRLPHHNKDYLGGRGTYSADVPKMDSICYGGVERMPWFDIHEDLYSGVLPENIKHLWLLIRDNNADLPSISIVQDLDIALNLLTYSNRLKTHNELIAIRSDELIDLKGTTSISTQSISWIGYDVVALPEWSLLRAGIFHSQMPFLQWKKHVNAQGLFDSLSFIDDYVEAYYQASLENIVEETWRLDKIAHIEVGRIRYPVVW